MKSKERGCENTMIKRTIQYLKNLEVVDYRIIVSILFLMMFGLIMVYSATSATDGVSTVLKQGVIGGMGLVAMILISYIDYHQYAKWAGLIYLAAVVAIFLVRVPGIGSSRNGAARWIEIGSFTFQPSELMKPAIVILMSYLIVAMGRNLSKVQGSILLLVPGAIGSALVLVVTKNLSTALLIAGIVAIMFFVAHPNNKIWLYVIVAVIAMILGSIVLYKMVVSISAVTAMGSENLDVDYKLMRILAWIYPEQFLESSRQTRYSLYAIGFGGLLGRGLGSGTMKYYIPEQSNDFIFAVIAEELGFVGCCMIIFLFVYQIWRILTVARHAKDKLGNFMALGIGAHVALQVIFNIGVATGLLPNTGVSLPYISYGGTALLLLLCEMGILLNISRQIPGRRVKVEGTSGSISETSGQKMRKTA